MTQSTLNPFLARLASDVPMISADHLVGLIEAMRVPDERLASLGSIPEPETAEHDYFSRMRRGMRPQMQMTEDGYAIVPVAGALARRPSLWELASGRVEDTDSIRELVEKAADAKTVRGILLSVDSPGGFFTGGAELAGAVEEAAQRKPVVAHTPGLMASLAYMVGSQATAVVASPSSIVGSIGTFLVHVDVSQALEKMGVRVEVFRNKEGKLKAPGVAGTSLTDEQRQHLQERADAAHGVFEACVRKKRGKVGKDSMRGQTFHGEEALAANLIDAVGTERAALAMLRKLAG